MASPRTRMARLALDLPSGFPRLARTAGSQSRDSFPTSLTCSDYSRWEVAFVDEVIARDVKLGPGKSKTSAMSCPSRVSSQ